MRRAQQLMEKKSCVLGRSRFHPTLTWMQNHRKASRREFRLKCK